ncbi:hypothetical protein [Nocardia tengchongensis]
MKPSLFLLVLYVEDIEASREFYATLGSDWCDRGCVAIEFGYSGAR